jgi:hypothetical protein
MSGSISTGKVLHSNIECYTQKMSIRLQVVLNEEEMEAIREDARRHGLTVSEWVRRALRAERRESLSREPARKLAAVRAAARHGFPTADIDQMLAEIERGYAAR